MMAMFSLRPSMRAFDGTWRTQTATRFQRDSVNVLRKNHEEAIFRQLQAFWADAAEEQAGLPQLDTS
jgi:hypothetical protein